MNSSKHSWINTNWQSFLKSFKNKQTKKKRRERNNSKLILQDQHYSDDKTRKFNSVTQSCPALQPHGLQHARLPCPSPTPETCSNSCPLSRWCRPIVLSCVVPFFSCLQSFPASGSFPVSQFFTSGGQSTGFSFSIGHFNEFSGLISFRIDWFDLLEVQGMLRSLLQHHSSKASTFQHSAFFIVQLLRPYMTTGKTIALTRCTFVSKVNVLLLALFLIGCLGWSHVFFQEARIFKFHGCSHHLQWFWSPRK